MCIITELSKEELQSINKDDYAILNAKIDNLERLIMRLIPDNTGGLTQKQIAEKLDCSQSNVSKKIQTHNIKPIKVDGGVKYYSEEVINILSNRAVIKKRPAPEDAMNQLEIAEKYGVHSSLISYLMKKNSIPFTQVGKSKYYKIQDFKFLDNIL